MPSLAAAHFELALGLCRNYGNPINEAEQAWQQALAIYDDIQHPDAGKVRTKLASTGN
jgi:hypothetical protein